MSFRFAKDGTVLYGIRLNQGDLYEHGETCGVKSAIIISSKYVKKAMLDDFKHIQVLNVFCNGKIDRQYMSICQIKGLKKFFKNIKPLYVNQPSFLKVSGMKVDLPKQKLVSSYHTGNKKCFCNNSNTYGIESEIESAHSCTHGKVLHGRKLTWEGYRHEVMKI